MNTNLLRKIDKIAGIPVTKLLSLGSKNKKPEKVKRILLIKLFGFGNIIFLSPTIKNLKKIFPGVKIDVLTFSSNKEICRMYSIEDAESGKFSVGKGKKEKSTASLISDTHVIKFSFFNLFYEGLQMFIKNSKKYDIVIDFEQFTRFSGIIGKILSPKFYIGSCTKNSGKSKIYDMNIEYKEKGHIVDEYYGVVKILARMYNKEKFIDKRIELIAPKKSQTVLTKNIIRSIGLDTLSRKKRLIVGACIGGREENKDKRYPIENFKRLIEKILNEHKNANIIFFGSKAESFDADEIISEMPKTIGERCMNLCGKLSLPESAECISHTKIFISNDTGPLHIASSLGIFCVALFGPTSEKTYGPYTKNCVVVRHKHGPVLNSQNEKLSHWSIDWWPSAEQVYDKVDKAIDRIR